MITEERARILSNFFLDGAKIVFASLVVGVFVPGFELTNSRLWATFVFGSVSTAAFLYMAISIAKKKLPQFYE